jgi:signal transduction histidine kinase
MAPQRVEESRTLIGYDVSQTLARERERVEAIAQIGRAIGSSKLDLDEILPQVIDLVSRLVQAERSTLFLIDRERGEIWSKVVQGQGLKEIRLPLQSGIVGWSCAHDRAVVVADARKDPRFNPLVDRSTGYRTRSILVVPLHDGSGAVVGAIQALNRKQGTFDEEDRAMLEAVAGLAGVAIENARLLRAELAAKAQLAESVRELDILFDIERRISGAQSMEDLVDAILAKTMEALEVEAGSILMVEEESGQLTFRSAMGDKGEEVKRLKLVAGRGIAGEVARTGEPIVTEDATRHPAWDSRVARKVGYAPRAVLCVPVMADGQAIGALELINPRSGRAFSESDLRLSTLVAGQLARAIAVGRERVAGERRSRLAAIGQMLAGLLHDLRTPMTVVSGYAELMAAEEDPVERRSAAALIFKELEHIGEMARETMAFARGDTDLLLRRVFLDKLLAELAEHLAREFDGMGIELKIQASYKGAARMDEGKIKRAIYNIARNAAEAMPDGGRFTLAVDKEEERVVFRLSDTGVGIPAEIADRLFESFVTAGKKDGTGLGLAIVKKVAEAHGGDVAFKSKPGKGTTFTMRIPA